MTTFAKSYGQDLQVIEGEVLSVDHRNPDSGFCVLKVESNGKAVSVVGTAYVDVGEIVEATGIWKNHARFGQQFDAKNIVARPPTSLNAISRYLASGAIKGIGPAWAGKITSHFGSETISVLDADPMRLSEIPGIGAKKAQTVAKAWEETRSSRMLLLALAEYQIGTAICHRLMKQYGPKVLEVVQKEPYRLAAEVRGIAFLKADEIAQRVGIAHDDPVRIMAGIRSVITEQLTGGSCGIRADLFQRKAAELLKLDPSLVRPVIAEAVRAQEFLVGCRMPDGEAYIFDKRLYDAEGRIARWVVSAMAVTPPWALDAAQAKSVASDAEASAGVELAPEQKESVEMALRSRVSVLTGGPGTGKTSTLKVILAALHSIKARVVLAAPTGKAAKRMRESTGSPAATVARLVGMGSQVEAPEVEADVVVVDEASMLDVMLLDKLLQVMEPGAALILVGDVDQLPSVSPGNVLGDLIDSQVVTVVRLTKVFRQAEKSAIIRNAHRINRGEGIEPNGQKDSDFYFIEANGEDGIKSTIVDLVSRRLPEYLKVPPGEIQVLSPMRRSGTGSESLNTVIQDALNPNPPVFIKKGAKRYGVGDRLIVCSNDYDLDVMNGESGQVVEINKESSIARIKIDERIVDYPFDKLDDVDLAYAMSVHKSQGSQFPAVVIPVTTQHSIMLQRSIIYTAITRASKFCVLVGERKALAMAIRNIRSNARVTTLGTRLQRSIRATGEAC